AAARRLPRCALPAHCDQKPRNGLTRASQFVMVCAYTLAAVVHAPRSTAGPAREPRFWLLAWFPQPPVAAVTRIITITSRLREALDDADVVVDAMNSSKPGVLLPATRALLDAAHTAGVGHYVGISIVGIERVPLGYYRAKLQQEEAIKAGPVAWSLLRATQFHSLIAALLAAADRFRVTPLPSARVQPVDPREVARELAARGVAGDRLGP